MKKLFWDVLKVIGFSILMTLALAIGVSLVPIPWALFFPQLIIFSTIFAAYFCFGPILVFTCIQRLTISRLPFLQRTYLVGTLAMLTCLFVTIQFLVNERGSSELFGPSGLTYIMLAQGSLFGLAVWRFLSGLFWPESDKVPRVRDTKLKNYFNKKLILILIANLTLGNIILYFHEVGGRNQTEVATNLWISFSAVAIVLLHISFRILNTKKSYLAASLLSLGVAFLVPALGLFFSMQLSLVALIMGTIYLAFGFYWVLPMFALNLFAFRWLQAGK